jgi:DNA topoisomerase-1
MTSFAKALPAIRARVNRDLKLQGLPRNKVLAAVVKLLEVSLVRVGNEEYAKNNNSFGLTTMKDRHVLIKGPRLRFQFRGKSGIHHEVDIENKRLARVVESCQDLPGQDLFQYVDDDGKRQDVKSGDVNDYLREISGAEFSAKDFRTWAGTVLTAIALAEFQSFESQAEAKKNISRAIEAVSRKLGNTAAICRKCYVHPKVIEAYLGGSLITTLKRRAQQQSSSSLRRVSPDEAAVLALLKQKLSGERSLAASLRASLKKTRHGRFKGPTAPGRRNNSVSLSRAGRRM